MQLANLKPYSDLIYHLSQYNKQLNISPSPLIWTVYYIIKSNLCALLWFQIDNQFICTDYYFLFLIAFSLAIFSLKVCLTMEGCNLDLSAWLSLFFVKTEFWRMIVLLRTKLFTVTDQLVMCIFTALWICMFV